MNALESKIFQYNEAYRSGNPLISDQEFDELMEQLRQEKPDSKLFKKGIIESVKDNRKQKLPIPMYSLNKVKSVNELKQWLKSNNILEDTLLVITPKFDGISLVVSEENGACWTRGDGEEGQISDKHFGNMPVRVLGEAFYSFGEAIISKENWKTNFEGKINPYSGEPYKVARNTVAGFFNADEPRIELRDVDYMRYGSNVDSLDKIDQLEALDELNSVPVNYYYCKIEELTDKRLDNLYRAWGDNYQIDGLVVDINSATLRQKLGREENMNPKYARAVKFPKWGSLKNTTVKNITWQVSKQGLLKPVINVEPVNISGVTIENVTGYNAKYIIDNHISKGAVIEITRSGDVIPKHLQTLSYNQNLFEDEMDNMVVCPSCGNQAKWDSTITELVCVNEFCKEKQISKLVHFFKTMEFEDFGEPSIRKLYEAGFDTLEKILLIDDFEICNIDGFGKKTANILINQFENMKAPLARVIHALDLTNGKVGEKTIQMIFDNIDISNWDNVYDIEKLLQINGVALVTAKMFTQAVDNYYTFFHGENVEQWQIEYIQTPKQEVFGDKFKDQKLCFTGCRPSKEQEQEIISQGGQVISGVSKNTTILVVKDLSEKVLSSSKAHKAKELGIKIIEIKEL